MKRFIGFLKKEFYHIFRDRRTLIILFGMPVAQVLLFGFVITNEIKNVKIAILDHSKDEITKQITNKILASEYFILDKNLSSDNEIESIFKAGNVKEILIFENNFAKKLEKYGKANIQIITDATDPNTANLIVSYTSAIILNYSNRLNVQSNVPMQIQTKTRMFYNPELKSVFMFVPGIMAMILMLISAIMTSISITREKEMGTMEILLVSPLKPAQIIIGKVMPYVILSFINAVTIIVLGMYVFGMPVQGSIPLLLAENVLFILLALSLGILISTTTDNQQAAMMKSMFGLLLPTILLSGFIYPIENMPIALQIVANLMPPRWFIIIIKDIMLKGTSFAFVWKETLILVAFTLFFLIISIKKFQIRLE
ncbi:MAG: ABC transporter permease [Bacteroidales bacterium]|nr:ABC transporter permease [Bacteroidales bacterium]